MTASTKNIRNRDLNDSLYKICIILRHEGLMSINAVCLRYAKLAGEIEMNKETRRLVNRAINKGLNEGKIVYVDNSSENYRDKTIKIP